MNLSTKTFQNSVIFVYVGLLIFLLQPRVSLGKFKDYFDQDLCKVKCGDRTHTLCETLPLPNCDKFNIFNIFEIPTLSNGKLLELLTNGHNGLRDRIAKKAKIGNMVKMAWDDNLAKMAVAYFKQCEPHIEDPCTTFFADDITEMEKIEYKEVPFENHRFIVQNRYRIEAEFFPDHFIESALRTWYREKIKLSRPAISLPNMMDYYVGIVREENNFTHLANPLNANFGCSIAQIDRYYELACNYYPFYRTKTSYMVYIRSAPTLHCNSYFPLKDESFVNLCDNGAGLIMSFSLKLMPPASCYVLLAIAEFVRRLM